MSGAGVIPGGAGGSESTPGGSEGSSMSYASCASKPPSIFDAGGRKPSKEDLYWECRRSLRIWPVAGKDLKKGLQDFLTTRLGFSQAFLSDMGSISIRKVAAGPRSKIIDEVIVVFSGVDVRDAIKGAARELAGADDAGCGSKYRGPFNRA